MRNKVPRLAKELGECASHVALVNGTATPEPDCVVIDLVIIECTSCSKVREFPHRPPLRGGEALRDFMYTVTPCACGCCASDVKCRLVHESN